MKDSLLLLGLQLATCGVFAATLLLTDTGLIVD